jgi:hypothetical protein
MIKGANLARSKAGRACILVHHSVTRGCFFAVTSGAISSPRCRTPHLWCEDGVSLYDAMGPEFTLLKFDPAADVAALESAARQRGVPLKVIQIKPTEAAVCCRARARMWHGAATGRPIRSRRSIVSEAL